MELKCTGVPPDHKSLQHILDQKELNMRQRRWERKENHDPKSSEALVMTISLDLPKQILNAQTEARKPENIKNEDVGGMLVENAKFPEAIREQKLEYPTCGWNPVPQWQKLVTLLWRFAEVIMHESHKSKYSIHPGSDKMYQDMKKAILVAQHEKPNSTMLSSVWTCAKVKVVHQRAIGMLV
ncbi:hypothetical protein Tco_0793960 [Tanacetum coccineum]